MIFPLFSSNLKVKEVKTKNSAKDENITENTFIGTSTKEYKWEIVWRNTIAFIYLHLGTIYGIYLAYTYAKWQTSLFAVTFGCLSGIGITAGAHRLWAHRAYKAKWQLRLFLTLLQTMAFQNHIYEWVRDHRVHHKFAETDADPHNAKRGFFFAHIGWLMLRKQKEVKEKGQTIDMSDLEADPIVMFQKKTYLLLMPLLSFVIPTWLPCYLWNEDPWVSWYVAAVLRFTLSLNMTWLVNSAAHLWGNKPYDRFIGPTDNWKVALGAFGEGWHNYHHVFPWDYKAGEFGNYKTNITTAFIDFFSYIGWAHDLKCVPSHVIKKRALRTGDGSHESSKHHSHENQIWGYGDKDMTTEDNDSVLILNGEK
ncbi:acyl-CoA Delta-9 desaturase-like [Arctopsyche grandis]|uniref:acyl-CoA Delta-9 desaturase-like n=1 Tax=Arctopsyche grandis TaxID=121162 RepID=UPI00406D7744